MKFFSYQLRDADQFARVFPPWGSPEEYLFRVDSLYHPGKPWHEKAAHIMVRPVYSSEYSHGVARIYTGLPVTFEVTGLYAVAEIHDSVEMEEFEMPEHIRYRAIEAFMVGFRWQMFLELSRNYLDGSVQAVLYIHLGHCVCPHLVASVSEREHRQAKQTRGYPFLSPGTTGSDRNGEHEIHVLLVEKLCLEAAAMTIHWMPKEPETLARLWLGAIASETTAQNQIDFSIYNMPLTRPPGFTLTSVPEVASLQVLPEKEGGQPFGGLKQRKRRML